MIIGFTGTQNGLTCLQKVLLRRILFNFPSITAVHHGDCVGADTEFDKMCCDILDITANIVIHPPAKRDLYLNQKSILTAIRKLLIHAIHLLLLQSLCS